MKKTKLLKKVSALALTAALTFASLGSMNLTTTATDTITVAPENMLNITVTDKNGTPVNGIRVTLRNANDNNRVAYFDTAETYKYESFVASSIKLFANDSSFYEWDLFESLVAPYELQCVKDTATNRRYWNNGNIKFTSGEQHEYELSYIDTSKPADLIVPANTFVTVVDPSWASRYSQGGLEIKSTKQTYSFNQNAGKTNSYPLAAGYYQDVFLTLGSSGGSLRYLDVSSNPVEYIKVRLKLSDICEEFNSDGTADWGLSGTRHYSFSTDSKSQSAALVLVSGSVVNAVAPDSQGYVEIYVEKSARNFFLDTHFTWNDNNSHGSGGGINTSDYAYDTKTYNFQAVTFPETGANLINVPAGEYTIELSNVPEQYQQPVTKTITVTDSQNIQPINIVLEDSHTHTADTGSWQNNEVEHWHKCIGCDEDVQLDKAEHTPGPEATEDSPQVCTVCGYVIAPALPHVHDYGTEYYSDEEQHWNECRCGDITNVQDHEFTWITDKEPTETEAGQKHEECTICGYKKAAIEIPVLEPPTKEPTTEEPTTEEPTTIKQEPSSEQPTTVKQEPATTKQEPAATQKTSTPITGDRTASTACLVLLLTSIMAFAGIFLAKNKKKYSEEQ